MKKPAACQNKNWTKWEKLDPRIIKGELRIPGIRSIDDHLDFCLFSIDWHRRHGIPDDWKERMPVGERFVLKD